jgi:putative ABC transport system permease protein
MAISFSYHWRSLFVRKSTTVLTIVVVAAVTAVFVWMLSFSHALGDSLSMASDPRKLIILKRGATAESSSAIPVSDLGKLSQLPEAEVDPATGRALLSPESLVQVQLPRLRDGGRSAANVAVRGVTADAFNVHRNVRLLGPMFSTGSPEVIVGLATARQFGGLAIGDSISLGYGGSRPFRIVGYFTADGGPLESEIWGYLPTLMSAYNRTLYSSVSLRLKPSADPAAAVRAIEGPSIQLAAQSEPDYWRKQSALVRVYLGIANALVAIMCLAAVFAVANTMFASVAGRTREIAMLRTIGFSGRAVLRGFLLESVMLSLIGGSAGCLACAAWLKGVGNTKDMFGASTFTTMAFEIRMVPTVVAAALAGIIAVGLAGALVPAVRASRLAVVDALREP